MYLRGKQVMNKYFDAEPLRKWKTDEEMEDKMDLGYEYVKCLINMSSRQTLVLVLNFQCSLPHIWLEQWT
jgi:hypothetical protein